MSQSASKGLPNTKTVTSRFPRRFDYLTWEQAEIAASEQGSTLIWPLGACEQHGPHLPLATDTLFSEQILEKVFDQLPSDLPVWMLPANCFGFSPEHASFPGTITISASLMMNLVIEVGQKIASLGFTRFILFNAHGGQIGLMHAASRELRLHCPQMAVLPCFLWSGVDSLKELIPLKERMEGLHAGLAETSLMLALEPKLVGEQRPVDGDHSSQVKDATPPEGWSLEGPSPCAWLTGDLSASGVIGDSRDSNSELGDRIMQVLTDHWIKLLINLMGSNWPPVRGDQSDNI